MPKQKKKYISLADCVKKYKIKFQAVCNRIKSGKLERKLKGNDTLISVYFDSMIDL
jgi:hypothetical protein